MRAWLAGFKHLDWVIGSSSLLLVCLGVLMIYSTDGSAHLWVRQIIFAALGMAGMIALMFFDYRFLRRLTPWLYVLVVVSLAAVGWLGEPVRGASRWIDLGFFRFQPSEFAKLIMIIVTAKVLDVHRGKITDFRYVALSLVYVAIPIGLILVQPDLGSAMVIFLTWLAMMACSRVSKKHLLWLLVGFTIVAIVAWATLLHDYQKQRIYTFLDPAADPTGSGYNVIQSMIAVGSGHIFGQGLGRGLQSQLRFLPERQTDFIFASTAEELGFVGGVLIVGLYFLLLYRLIKLSRQARDNFGTYLALGVFLMLAIEIVINVGMNVGLVPVTGIPLPWLSYGGSAMLTMFMALGIIQSVTLRRRPIKFA